MPTVKLNKKEVLRYIGRKYTDNELKERIPMIGVDLEDINEDDIIVEIFPNRPDMMSEPGFGRALSSFFGIKTGLRKYNTKKSSYKVIIDKNLKNIRPYTSAAVVKNLKLNNEKIKELIQIQEKLHVTYGRNRKRCAIGIYPLDNIKMPIIFKAAKPEDIKFKPLDADREMNGTEILDKHPAGKEYGYLIKDYPMFPVFVDSNNKILSLTPIINSEYTGRVTEKIEDVFIEVSGHDFNITKKCLNIIVTALSDMNGEIYSVELDYGKKIQSPDLENEKIKINPKYLCDKIGVSLKENEIKKYIEHMGFSYSKNNVMIPAYRADILHEIDIAEDVAIAYGYNNFKVEIPKVATIGEEDKIESFKNKIAGILTGFGLIEASTFSITNSNILNKKMNLKNEHVELANALTNEYNILRNSLLPLLLEVLEKNRHNEYPQKIFELGKIFLKDVKEETGIKERNMLSAISCHSKADYTEVKQFLDSMISSLGLKVSIEESSNESFIDGRVGDVYVNSRKIGYIGELKPEVITSFSLDMPVSGFEIDLDELFSIIL
ncbi:phenylalanine--tRNA ligase subunit beta [Candidatus Woesearchaeota archaeon]|nr:phenylalanine--tRNA ligase subunit beta [Candidatus Woesearchaeota archaeon]